MNNDMNEWLRDKLLNGPSKKPKRFLNHLMNLGDDESRYEAAWIRTQPGVAEALGCARTWVSKIALDAISVGFIEGRSRHIVGGPSDGRKRVAYFITPEGRAALKT